MGEFVVDAALFEDKMGETAASNSALQVSISFGRFENDSLSWERWSSFSPNKYLEEVEKCATPGSVAQKKAYFEAHYKRIAARKAELLAQEKEAEKDSSGSEDQNGADLSGNTDAEFDVSNTQGSTEGVMQDINSVGEISGNHVDELKEEEVAVSRDDYQSSSIEVENKELESGSHGSHQIDEPEEDVYIKQEENLRVEAEDVKEISHVEYKETEKVSEVEAENVQLDHPKESKVTSVNRESNATITSVNRESNAAKTKKKSMLPKSKASQMSTPRSSKPASTPTKTLASASSTKKGNSPSLSRKPSTSSEGSRKVPNKSLHMSLNLDSSNPSPAPHTSMRKSSIMEKMGDKDIVKRAFKTFQNNYNQPKTSGDDNSLVKKQVPSRGTASKVPTSTSLRKENGRPNKVESRDTRSGSTVRTTSSPKTDITSGKGKESSRKIDVNSHAKVLERTRLQSKLKEEKEAEKLKHNFKATPLPAFYGGQKVSKIRPEKADAKTEKPR